MARENMTTLIAVKIVCCAALLFFLFGGLGLLAGATTGNIILAVLGATLAIWGIYMYFRKKQGSHGKDGET
ncbi:MAG TPA: hypothetical protein ENK29_01700 [Chromatiales bacterium]|nr:hypothetical protein [Chromatiales bacterium]